MLIDTTLIKASYNLMTQQHAMAYSVVKLADDVRKGKALQTFKLTRFIDDDGWDFLKFNFPVCGNLSSADLMVMYSALNGFDTYVVGNAERGRRDAVIRKALKIDNIYSVPELPIPLEVYDCPEARRMLSFTNTQQRGFNAMPAERSEELVLEMAGDQPLLYNTFRHAMELSRQDVDMAINLNAVSLMKLLVPSFVRNGYDAVVNSRKEQVVFKENNNFAQDWHSMQNNKGLFDFLYGNRNGGAYLNVMRALWEVGPGKLLARSPEILAMVPDLKRYISGRKHIVDSVSRGVPHGGVPSYKVLSKVFNIVVSPSLLEDRVYVDATNDDIFACWDMDGLNNDFLGYKMLFDRNMHNLCAIMPFADKVYVVDEAMARAGEGGGVMTARRFSGKYDKLAILAAVHLNDPAFLRQAGIDDDTIDRMRELHLDQRLMDREVPEQGMVQDIEAHLKGFYLPALSVDEAKYLHFS